MSTKTTYLYLPCCHIYRDFIGESGEETLCIDVNYGDLGGYDCIEVKYDSEFAKLILILIEDKNEEQLTKLIKGLRK